MSLLARLADEMRRDVRPGRAVERILAKGLKLMLALANERYWLHLWRDGAAPSDREIAIVRDAFAVPDGAPSRFAGTRYIVHWPVCGQSHRATPALPIRIAVPVVVGVVGTPVPIQPGSPCGLDPDDPWLRLQRQLAADAERRGDHDRAARYRHLAAGARARPGGARAPAEDQP